MNDCKVIDCRYLPIGSSQKLTKNQINHKDRTQSRGNVISSDSISVNDSTKQELCQFHNFTTKSCSEQVEINENSNFTK